MHRILLWLSIFVFSCFSPACAQGESPDPADLYARHCLSCHSSAITCLELDQDRAYWSATVKRMFKKDNTSVTTEDLQSLIDFLDAAAPGSQPVCK